MHVTDPSGNELVDLTRSIFKKDANPIKDYTMLHMDAYHHMRPDLVSHTMFGTDRYTELILKFTGVSNPFTLDDDDVLIIPNAAEAEGMLVKGNEEGDEALRTGTIAQIRNFYKFVNQDYKSDRSSYDKLANMNIPSGVINPSEVAQKQAIVPYISEDGRTAVTIRGGKMYFGEDMGMPVAGQSGTTTVEGVTKNV